MHIPGLTLNDGGDVATIVLAFVAGIGALAASLRGMRRWLTADTASSHEVKEVVDQAIGYALEPVWAEIKDMKEQITPNGGNSDTLGDRVVRIEEAQTYQSRGPKTARVVKKAPAKKAVKKR